MFLSKSFGYALRGVLYVALVHKEAEKVQLVEIAKELKVPRHFLAKIMKLMVKEGVLSSTKGPYGGFYLNESTLDTKLIKLFSATDGVEQFNNCVLSLKKCSAEHPCPLHFEMLRMKENMLSEFSKMSIGSLIDHENPDFLRSISTMS